MNFANQHFGSRRHYQELIRLWLFQPCLFAVFYRGHPLEGAKVAGKTAVVAEAAVASDGGDGNLGVGEQPPRLFNLTLPDGLAISGFNGSSSAPIVATNLTVKGVTTITVAGTFATGEYPLIKFVSGIIGGGGSFTMQQSGLPRGVSASIVTNAANHSIDLVLVTNNAKNFTISATGDSALTGGMALTKRGPGVLAITESNSFTGGVTISGGAVNLQNSYAFNANAVTVNTNAELQLQGGISFTPATTTTLTVTGTGTNSTGGLHNVSGNKTFGGPITLASRARITSDSGTLTLTNGVTTGTNLVILGGSGIITISTKTISGSGGLVKDGTGTNIWNLDPSITSGGMTVSNGTFQINVGNFDGTFTPLITVEPSATLWGNTTHATGGGAAVVVNRGTWLMSDEDYKQNLTMVDGTIAPGPNPDSADDLRVGLAGGSGSYTWYVSNSVAGSVINTKLNTIGSGVTLTWNVTRGVAPSDLTINGVINNPGNIIFTGNGITALTAVNTYTGTTTVSNGTLLVNGSLAAGSVVTVAAGATLAGAGIINGATTIQFGGILQPGLGGLNTSSLANNNSLNLAGKAVFNLNRTNAQNSSRVTGITTATYGGMLTMTNPGPALQAGDTGYSFANWSDGGTANPRTDVNVTNNLTVTANFVAGNLVPPVISSAVMQTGGSFTLGGTGAAGQTYILLTASDLESPVWTAIATNTADTNGVFNFNDAQATNFPQRFYRLATP